MWKRKDDSKIYSDNEVKNIIETLPHKAFYISGPTKSGKTPLIKSLEPKDKHIISSEAFYEKMIDICKNEEVSTINEMLSAFGSYRLLCIEDADIKLGGRTVAQELTRDFLIRYLEKGTAVFTGIKLESALIIITEAFEKDRLDIFYFAEE